MIVLVPKESIELWRIDLDQWAGFGLDPTSLTKEDRDTAERLRDSVVAKRLLARRSAVRSMLAGTLGTDPSEPAIGRTCFPPTGRAIVAVADESGENLVSRTVGGPPAPAVA